MTFVFSFSTPTPCPRESKNMLKLDYEFWEKHEAQKSNYK
jgi:hypothetical protein